MNNTQHLSFLRPYLHGCLPANKVVYVRLFTASCRPTPSRPSCPAPQALLRVQSIRSISEWAEKKEEYLTDSAALALNIERRVQKLEKYDALKYPRLGRRPDRMGVPEFREAFKAETSTPAPEEVVLEGRIMTLRRSGAKLVFLHILGGYQQVQAMVDFAQLPYLLDHFKKALKPLRRGDIISIKGKAIRTKAGELTLSATELPTLLSPAIAPLPEKLTNVETRILNRQVDFLVNQRASDTLRLRSQVVKSMRDFFHEQDFLEVQTPMLADSAGGAIARPFLTSATEFPEKSLSLRIAPELWLKRLVVGGNDKVFEIGQSFRNEGLDPTHNPEFTTCEFYSAYTNLPELISMTEDLIGRLVKDATRAIQSRLTSLDAPNVSSQDGRWKQVEFIPALEEILGFKFPDLSDPSALQKLRDLLADENPLATNPELSLNKALDYLASAHLEKDSFGQPLFIIHHPACMAPLSKSFTCPKTGQLVSARAELFIEGREIANMYEEENDPFEQRRKFEEQVRSKNNASDDEDPSEIDESYVQALEHGLPPTGGWGCGVDRLVMLLSGSSRISDTLPFGNLKNIVSLASAAKS
ncbi:hypothetical protein GGR57DRAFT_459726 [Xylariaceae sp. FL1272]|nr:hypothetical protein GGR57DRAFT_459726 [Xylariaceae sp. FL1272]